MAGLAAPATTLARSRDARRLDHLIAGLTASRAALRPWPALPLVALAVGAAVLIGALIARDPVIGIAVAVGACYAPIVLLDLAVGIVIWVPLAFFERVPLAGPGPTLIVILVAVAFIGALPSLQHQVAAVLRRHGAVFGLLFGFFAWLTISITWAADSAAAVDDFWLWIVAVGVFVVVATAVAGPRAVLGVMAAFVIGALASEVAALVQGTATEAELAAQEAGRLGAGGQDPNYLASGLVPGAAIGVGLLPFAKPGPVRWALLAAIVALVVGIVATGSRGGLVATTIAIVTAIIVARGQRLQLAAVVAVLIAVGSFWFSTSSLERVRDFDSGNGRVDLWRVATEMSSDHPVLGVGVNNFRERSVDYVLAPAPVEGVGLVADNPYEAHSLYLQQLAETGVVGFVLFAGLLLVCLRASWLAARRFDAAGETRWAGLARSVLVAQVAMLTASLFISNGSDRRLWLLLTFGILLSSVAATLQERRT